VVEKAPKGAYSSGLATPAVSVPGKPTPVHAEVPRPKPPQASRRRPPPEKAQKEEILPAEVLEKVLQCTKGKRAAVLAGQASKNEPIRYWMESFFQFKDVAWHDRDGRVLFQSLACKSVDMLFIFPKWYARWKPYFDAAKANGIRTVMLDNSNKKLISQKVAEAMHASGAAAAVVQGEKG
jgi:hypothetical protein